MLPFGCYCAAVRVLMCFRAGVHVLPHGCLCAAVRVFCAAVRVLCAGVGVHMRLSIFRMHLISKIKATEFNNLHKVNGGADMYDNARAAQIKANEWMLVAMGLKNFRDVMQGPHAKKSRKQKKRGAPKQPTRRSTRVKRNIPTGAGADAEAMSDLLRNSCASSSSDSEYDNESDNGDEDSFQTCGGTPPEGSFDELEHFDRTTPDA